MVAGEITTSTCVDVEGIVRKTVTDIGYDNSDVGFDGNTCAVINELGEQSPDIAQGVDRARPEEQGAGDQGLMFGYASDETDAFMPAPIVYAHRLVERQASVRRSGVLETGGRAWLRPDAKSQVTFRYEDGRPAAVEAVVLSTQHAELEELGISLDDLREAVMEHIIEPVLPEKWLGAETRYHINPTGRFVTGGPKGDCGLTGRKIIVDTYGGMARHGGGAFSGKDPSKVDRSAAYAARYVAKNVVAAGLASRCEIQVSYAIGVAEPTSISRRDLRHAHRGRGPDRGAGQGAVRPDALRIQRMLDLLRPIYLKTAAYGHFGREDPDFTWERTDRAEALKDAAKVPSVRTA